MAVGRDFIGVLLNEMAAFPTSKPRPFLGSSERRLAQTGGHLAAQNEAWAVFSESKVSV